MLLGGLLAFLLSLSSSKITPAPQSSIAQTVPSSAPEEPVSSPTATLTYQVHHLPRSTVHVLHVPANAAWRVVPALASGVDTLENFAEANQAVAVINGGFFDPVNQKTTSYVILNGEAIADPTENERLVNNPEMIPYLDRILDRSEFRQYQCGQTIRYSVALHHESAPADCQLFSALGAGPQLLPELRLVEEGFAEIVNGEWIRDALGSTQPNARTAVGITAAGEVLLVMAAQLPEMPSNSGLSLPQLAEFMQTIGAETAINLDGGSSSTLYYQDQTYYGKVDSEGNLVERTVKSVLLVQSSSDKSVED